MQQTNKLVKKEAQYCKNCALAIYVVIHAVELGKMPDVSG